MKYKTTVNLYHNGTQYKAGHVFDKLDAGLKGKYYIEEVAEEKPATTKQFNKKPKDDVSVEL